MPAITIKITNLAAVVRKRADFSQDRTKGGLGFCILARSMLVGAWLCEFFLQNEPTRQSTFLGSLLGRPGLKRGNAYKLAKPRTSACGFRLGIGPKLFVSFNSKYYINGTKNETKLAIILK